jgi:hypothetical protein
LKALLGVSLTCPGKDEDIDLLERLFRKGEALARQAGGVVLRLTRTIANDPGLIALVRQANERRRASLRFVLREMSMEDWSRFKAALEPHLPVSTKADDLGVLELVLRTGESVTNVEAAASAKANQIAGLKLMDPEVARRNALIKSRIPGAVAMNPDVAYAAAKRALDEVEQVARRARHTLAYEHVSPSSSYRHARNTLFQLLDTILESEEMVAFLAPIEKELTTVPPLARERLRWALHRMPVEERIAIIESIPLNTILMLQESSAGPEPLEVLSRASRDRRMAYDLFVRGRSDEELAAAYGLSVNGVKNAIGVLLETLAAKPLVRKTVHAFLARVDMVPPMSIDEVRSRMKRLTPEQRAELVNGIPNRAWKVPQVITLHKNLFLDHMTGEWVLAALVQCYNLAPDKRLIGVFRCDGALTVRGANAAIAGTLQKVSDEPLLREQLRQWTSINGYASSATLASKVRGGDVSFDVSFPPR